MLARQRWCILLMLALVLTFLASPRVFAAPGASEVHTQSAFALPSAQGRALHVSVVDTCSYNPNPVSNPIPTLNTEPALMVISDNWRKATYFCGSGYKGLGKIENVNEIYDNAGAPVWFKWYRNGVSHFCAFGGLGGYQNFDPPVKVTQVDYGDTHASDRCGS